MSVEPVVTGKSIKTRSCGEPYAPFYYGFVRGLRPCNCVELGTYAGFSAYFIASALKDNGFGHLDCYDLWGKYPYHHVDIGEAKRNLKDLPVRLFQEDANKVFQKYLDINESVDLLHVDLSNDGGVYRKFLHQWYDILSSTSYVLLEGGAKARDYVQWMLIYHKEAIRNALKDKKLRQMYKFTLYDDKFPGITIAEKR